MSPTASAPTERRRANTGTRPRRSGRHPEGLERLRILLAGAMGAVLVGYALLVPVAALLLLSGGAGSMDGAFAVAVPMWLAAHQIPVEVQGRALGVLPLLPTAVVVGVVAVAAGWSVRRLGGRIRHDAGPVVAGQAGAAAAVAVLAGALLPGDVAVTTPWASMVGAGLLAGLAAGAGVLRACGLPPAWERLLRGWPRAAVTGAMAGAIGLLLSGAVVVLLTLTVHAGAVATSFAGLAPGAGASAGVLLLAVGYLPNAVVAGTAWSLGPGFAVGAAQYGPFGTLPGPLPPFPLFAALPPDPAPVWAAAVLLLPLGAGVLAGRACRRVLGASAPLRERMTAAATAAAATALGAGLVAAVAGGSLAGGGPYDPVSLSPVGVVVTALLLLGVPATIAAAGVGELLGRPQGARRPSGALMRPSAGARRAGTPARPRGEGSTRSRRPARDGPGGDGSARDGSAGRARSARDRSTGAGSRTTQRSRPRTVGDLVAQQKPTAEPDDTAGPPDTDTPDTGTPDTGTPDTGTPDTGTPDTGTPGTGIADTGTPDPGTPDSASRNAEDRDVSDGEGPAR